MQAARYISLEQMEELTERILMDYGFDPYDKMIRPVPIEEIIEFHFDLNIGWEPIDHLDQQGMVMAAIFPTEKQIVLNETHRDLFEEKIGTYHFTLAHELGHWVLHAQGTPYWTRLSKARVELSVAHTAAPFYCRSFAQKPMVEVQADLFAGCLLMPRPILERAITQLRRIGLIQLSHLYRLAEGLRVSISALTVRLTQAQLLHIDSNGRIYFWGAQDRTEHVQLSIEF
ncbi:ImmA/IrrE family metallo-endopeptidase [Paenibacillus sp. OAS669]|uniref:ImmA/IrrE family metallo-endopeptidase n=1 Tax=Paenibacillus sp. OAS669 TaxID=2663821 RepID=UPI0017897573|nr:ImmA/IrrE family metallo-endopeptidase [Paenibacillus sp. OAS669]MBE1445141.1 Zn-dependent peptidase ImmA (M78 family) [Paenibacillus sp. OAS669]